VHKTNTAFQSNNTTKIEQIRNKTSHTSIASKRNHSMVIKLVWFQLH